MKDAYLGIGYYTLTSKRSILYIIQQIQVLNILNMVYTVLVFSSKCSLFQNSNVFGSCIIHILYTGCAKIKKNSGAKSLIKHKVYPSTCKPASLLSSSQSFRNHHHNSSSSCASSFAYLFRHRVYNIVGFKFFIKSSARSITVSNTTCYCNPTFLLLVLITSVRQNDLSFQVPLNLCI